MKYFASVETKPGLNRVPDNPCEILGFELLNLGPGEVYEGVTGDREVLAVLLGGRATFDVSGKRFERVGGRPNVFSGKPHSVYMSCGSVYTIVAEEAVSIALASAPSDLPTAPYVIGPERVATGAWGAANFKRYFHQILTLAAQPDLSARRLIAGETFTPSGNWSTYPPHRHEVDDLPREAKHEEIYFFKVNPPDGFGICRYYNAGGAEGDFADVEGDFADVEGDFADVEGDFADVEGDFADVEGDFADVEDNFTVRDNTILMAPYGYHTVVSAPGYTTYYLWFLGGEHRIQATADDPTLGWVSRTIPMLKELER